MKKSIILELDSFYLDRIIAWFNQNEYYEKYTIYALVKHYKIEEYSKGLAQFSNIRCIQYEDLFNYDYDNYLDLNEYFNFNQSFLNNHLTSRFLDRAGYYPKYGIGNQNAFCYYTFKAYNLLAFLKEKKIEFICFRNTPHSIDEWILSQAIEFLNIDFYSLEDFIFPWLFTIKKGCLSDTELVFDNLEMNDEEELKGHIKKCIEINSGKYEDAIPTYEKERLGTGILKYYNPFSNIQASLRKPHQFYTKTRNFFFYKSNSKTFDLEKTNYFIFFLHFQPERSSLPEGFHFVDQFYTIRLLSQMLPKGIKLLVKEHPSMFTKLSEPKFRSIENYTSITKLENVELVKMNVDSFSLIDNALAVATIKGTVTLETYMRKKPIIMFGKTNLKLPGVYNYTSFESLQEYINDVIAGNIKIKNRLDNLVSACLKVSVSGLTKPSAEMDNYSFNRDIRENASYKLLDKLLDYKLK